MLSVVFGRAHSSKICSQCLTQVTACNFPMLQPVLKMLQKSVTSFAPHVKSQVPAGTTATPVALQKLNTSAMATQVPIQKLHGTGLVLRSIEDQSTAHTHVFRIRSKLPSSPQVDGSFSFFSIRSLFSTPAPYLLYGLGGLIPFMSAPLYMYLSGEFSPTIAHAQLVYGACILSFLGGVSWGNHLHRSEGTTLHSLSYSIVLPLVAWPSLLLYPNPSSFLLMTGGIIYAGVKDTRSAVAYPRWFKNLRFLLSSLVALSLSATLLFQFTLQSENNNNEHNDE